jgi:hypothetical protein
MVMWARPAKAARTGSGMSPDVSAAASIGATISPIRFKIAELPLEKISSGKNSVQNLDSFFGFSLTHAAICWAAERKGLSLIGRHP